MTRTDISPMPAFFDRYIKLVDEGADLLPTLAQTADFELLIPLQTAETLGDRVYAPGKWTIRDILQHLIDTERIMAYRALRFARADKTPLPGFDEELFGQTSGANQRLMSDLYGEYTLLRQTNRALFQSFTDEMLQRRGVGNYQNLSVLAIGFMLIGHAQHHVNIIRERYLPLLNQ
ncbi:MAG: DinB family protein [Spirosoma sp.]|nr:DinB family protein [Spirosoma sp.]